jgi:MinD superfamily P-loop ATPase
VTDALLLVCELDTATLKNVRIALETLELLKFPAEHVSLVLNRTGPATSIKRSELEAALGTRVRFEVPYDADVPTAVGRGTPRVLARGDFSRVVAKVAWELGPRPGSAGKPAAAPAATNGNGTGRRGWLGLRRR